jgi:hypothetical protein
MRNQYLILRFSIGFLLLLFAGGVYAQVDTTRTDTIKTLPPIVVTSKANIEARVTEAFDKQFKDAVDPQWYKLSKNYLVKFIQNDMTNNALYKKNGRLIYHIGYGQERNLPDDVRTLVKNSYADYNIISAVNVHQDERNVWVVGLEGMKKLIQVRVEDGQLEEVGNYDKSM